MKNHEGKIEGVNVAKEGTKKDGSHYKLYKYTIGKRIFSSFKNLEELKAKIGDYTIVAYEEAENKTYPDKPYKNIVNLTQAVTPKEMQEENKKVNMIDVGKPTSEEPVDNRPTAKVSVIEPQADWEEINRIKQLNKDVTVVFINTCNYIDSHKANYENFPIFFDKLWNILQKKRKEKLE